MVCRLFSRVLSAYEEVTLLFDRFVDEGIGDNEYLAVAIGNNGEYTRLDTWGAGDSTWQTETYTLTDLSDAFTIQFIARPSVAYNANVQEILAVDNVVIRVNGAADAPEPEPNENLTIATNTSVPLSVRSGNATVLRATVTNNGTESAASATIRVYRHKEPTTTPHTSGTEEGRAATGTIAAGADAPVTVSVTVPAVSTAQTYHYYLCIDTVPACAAPIEIRVQPAQTTTNVPDFSIPTITATQASTTITVQTTVRNSGVASGNTRPITVYRHTATTAHLLFVARTVLSILLSVQKPQLLVSRCEYSGLRVVARQMGRWWVENCYFLYQMCLDTYIR